MNDPITPIIPFFSLFFYGSFFILWLAICAFNIALLVVWILMLVDLIKRPEDKFGQGKDQKTVWLLIVILGGVIGSVVYYFLIYKKYGKA